MRTRKKDTKNLIKTGLFITGLTFVLMIMIVSIGKENSVFDSKVTLRARVSNVSNLKVGSYIELKGVRIGTVTGIEIVSETDVEIAMSVLADKVKWIKKDSDVAVSTAGLVGDKYLEIFTGSASSPQIDPAKDILISADTPDMKAMLSKGESIAEVIERILLKVDRILVSLEDGKPIVKMVNSMSKTSSNMESLTEDLKGAKLVDTIKNVNGTMTKLNGVATSLEQIMVRIQHGPGTANSLIYDDSLHDDLRALMGGAQRNKVIKYFIRESIKDSEKKH